MALTFAGLTRPAVAAEVPPGGNSTDAAQVVVTAQFRAQSLQDVPIAVQVLDGAAIDLHAADDISALASFVPALSVAASSPTQPKFAIRGITSTDFGIGTDPVVGVYVDGVYAGRSGALVPELTDIDRIEVLKGPQGTLFGRNSAAGAVSIITNKPVDKAEARLDLRIGNYGERHAEAMVNLPLAGDLALRVNAVINHRDGLYVDAATGQRRNREQNWAGRGQLRWTPGPETEVILGWTHDQIDQDSRAAFSIVALPAYPATPPVNPAPAAYVNPLTAPLQNGVVDPEERRNLNEVTLRIGQGFGAVRLDSLTSWRQFTTSNRQDESGSDRIDLYAATGNIERNTSFSQELRLSGTTRRVDWLAGISFANEVAGQVNEVDATTDSIDTLLGNAGLGTPFANLQYGLVDPAGVPLSVLGQSWAEAIVDHGDNQAYAAFGDAIWHVDGRLNLTAGLRYTRDIKTFDWYGGPRTAPGLDATLATLNNLGVLGMAGLTPANFDFNVIFNMAGYAGIPCDSTAAGGVTVTEGVTCELKNRTGNFSPRAIIDYRVADGIRVFASYARGYKAGGFDAVEPGSRFRNEIVDNFEAGVKAATADRRLVANASAFHYVYDNRQSLELEVPPGGLLPVYVTDTSDEHAWGADIDVRWTPRSLPVSLFANEQFVNATYKRKTSAAGQDMAGQPTGVPLWTVAAGGEIRQSLRAGTLAFDLTHSFSGACRPNADSLAQGTCAGNLGAFTLGGAHNRTDLRLELTLPGHGLSAGLFVTNLFDNRYVAQVGQLTAGTLGTPYAVLTNPRFFGADLDLRY